LVGFKERKEAIGKKEKEVEKDPRRVFRTPSLEDLGRARIAIPKLR
jgi:hypothetical protein